MDPKGQNEVDKFFDGLPSEETKEVDIFEDPKAGDPAQAAEGAEDGTKVEKPERRENRQTRRLKEQLQQEREARIAAEARAEGRAEIERSRPEAPGEVPDAWLRIYGDSPESRQAWQLNKGIFEGLAEKAKEKAVAEIDERQQNETKAAKEFESFIDQELEAIEDEFDVDVTSDSPAARKARRELLELVESLSPKDADGDLTGYADFTETWKLYRDKSSKKRDASPNKDLAARSMERSGEVAPSEKKQTPGFFGWKQDLGL